jgi:hypothetical protein
LLAECSCRPPREAGRACRRSAWCELPITLAHGMAFQPSFKLGPLCECVFHEESLSFASFTV